MMTASTIYNQFKDWEKLNKSLFSGDTSNKQLVTKTKSTTNEGKISFTPKGVKPVRVKTKLTPRNLPPKIKATGTTTTSLIKGEKLIQPKGLNLPFTAGTVDYTFPNGDGYGFDGSVYSIKVQPDGKILVGGDFAYYYYDYSSYYSPYLIRLNSDGTVDESFSTTYNWDNYGGSFNNQVLAIDIQEDGKILVGGDFTYYDRDLGSNSNYIIRLNPDGSKDDTFFIGDGFNESVTSIIVQPDGKILAAGYFYQYNNSQYDPSNGPAFWRIIRLNQDGSTDSSFNPGYGIDWDDYGVVNSMILQPDGKIILGGDFYSYNNISNTNYIVRLNSDGTKDTTFVIGNGFNDTVITMALQSTGKIIVGGYFDTYDNNYLFSGYIVRLGVNGNLDTKFGYGLNNEVTSIAVQSDDKIIVGGYFGEFYPDNFNTIFCDELVRFQSDCTFDYSFYYEELFNNAIYSIVILNDGKLLVGGEFNTNGDPTTYPLNYFGRLNNEILVYPYVYRIIDCSTIPTPIYYNIGSNTPLNVNDTISVFNLSNPSFINCGVVTDIYPSTTIDYEYITSYNDCDSCLVENSKYVVLVSCLDGNGGPAYVSPLYNVGDILYLDYYDENIDSFVKSCFNIVEELPFEDDPAYFPIIPYQPIENCESCVSCNGVYYVWEDCLDSNINGVILSNQYMSVGDVFALPIYGEGEGIIGVSPCKTVVFIPSAGPYSAVSGSPVVHSTIVFNNCEDCITQMVDTLPGKIDETFNVGLGSDNLSIRLLIQPDNKVLLGGYFTQFNGVSVGAGLIRLNTDGSINTTISGTGFNDYVKTMILQSDGKIICGSEFTLYNGTSANHIIRLNPDFSIDNTFNYGTGFNNSVFNLLLLSDNKILVGGIFTEYNGNSYNRVIKLNSDGSIDTSFVIGTGFDSYARALTEQPDGKLLIGGNFTSYDGNLYNKIIRLNSDGSIDTSFVIGTGFDDAVVDIKIQSDGKILIIGDFTSYDGNSYKNLIRLNSDGSIDNTFIIGTGFNTGTPIRMELQPDGKILITGAFSFYDGNSFNRIVRLNSDGSIDNTFSLGSGLNQAGLDIKYTSDNKIYVCGYFTDYDGNTANQLVRLYGEELLSIYNLYDFTTCDGDNSYVYLPTSSTLTGGNGPLVINEITYSPITSSGLDLIEDGSYDDTNFVVDFPTSFGVNFLGTGFTSVNVSSNPYITFGSGGNPDNCCFDIPNEIPSNVELPGVFLSFECPNIPGDYDSNLYRLYTGLTDGGNTMIIRFEGTDHCDEIVNLTYNFKFYKNQLNYFDLVIEENTSFFNGDPTGGASDGISESWLATFDSSSETAWRIGSNTTSIKGNLNNTPVECGIVGSEVLSITADTFSLYYSDGATTYENCDSCVSTIRYKVTIKDCVTNEVKYVTMTQSSIDQILNSGPIFSDGGIECYEMLDYCFIPNNIEMLPYLFYDNCELCLSPLSANTETIICQSICDSSVISIVPPHPVYTNLRGKAVIQLNMISLGGENGLNS